MLSPAISSMIKDFVRQEPRTIDEIARKIKKSWLTADRYVEKISTEDGSIRVKTFRGGTRGALKLVFWNNTNSPAQSSVQEKLFASIMRGRKKFDFSPLDIYQHVDETRRSAMVDKDAPEESKQMALDVAEIFPQAKKQILIFSGNLSWSNLSRGKTTLLSIVESLARQGVSIKVLTRVDLAGIDNIHRMIAVNQRIGKDMVEVRHCEQPLRAFVVDDSIAQFKEVKCASDYKPGELARTTNIYYRITDHMWVAWVTRVFWHMFAEAVSAQERIKVLRSIRA